jgi:hypothetical protein
MTHSFDKLAKMLKSLENVLRKLAND